MKVEIVKFEAKHGIELRDKGALTYLASFISDETFKKLEQTQAFSALKNGAPIYCGGLLERWAGRAEAWAFFSTSIGSDFLVVHRATKRLLEVSGYRRIEAVVDHGFKAGHRWMKMLGFNVEAERMVGYAVDGRDTRLYARIRKEL